MPFLEARPDSQVLTLPDGRRLAYAEYGDPHGQPTLYFHGFPGSRVEAALAHSSALGTGARLIAVDRGDRRLGSQAGSSPAGLADRRRPSGGPPWAGALRGDRCLGRGDRTRPSIPSDSMRRHRLRRAPFDGKSLFQEHAVAQSGHPASRATCTVAGQTGTAGGGRAGRAIGLLARAMICGPRCAGSKRDPGNVRAFAGRRGRARADMWTAADPGPAVGLSWKKLARMCTSGRRPGVVPASHGRHLCEPLPRSHCEFLPREGHFSLVIDHAARIFSTLEAARKAGAQRLRSGCPQG